MKLSSPKYIIPVLIVLLLAVHIGITFAYQQAYAGKVLPGVQLGNTDIGNKTREEALVAIRSAAAPALTKRSVVLNYPEPLQDGSIQLTNVIAFNESSVDEAYAIGRSAGTKLWFAPYALRWFPAMLDATKAFDIQDSAIQAELRKRGLRTEGRDASFTFVANSPEAGRLSVDISPHVFGYEIDEASSLKDVRTALATGATSVDIRLARQVSPAVTTEMLTPLVTEVTRWVTRPLTLTREKETLVVSQAQISDLLAATTTQNGTSALILEPSRLANFFAKHPFTATNTPKNGSLRVSTSSTIEELTLPTQGQVVDLESTRKRMEEALRGEKYQAALDIKTSWGVFEGPDAERLGIRELLGRGDSHFSGSPTNRRKNIALGAERVHGTIVAPNTTFSMMKTLGAIDASGGWLPELVIKGNKTTPEYGGGLCQIGTTAFRAALNVGFPITERRNHSYRVRYYEPAGTDATLYDPSPDFKFHNDSPAHILITKDLRKDDVSFLIWGTKDGRVASSTKPVVSNIVAPPPKKLVETTEIPVGTTKCTESEHAGATARFNYSVQYANGRMVTTTFTSVYRPWQAVCLVGVAAVNPAAVATPTIDETGLNNPG